MCQAGIESSPFGHTPSGTSVELYELRNRRGMEVRIATFGGIVTYLSAPDHAGRYADVVLGYDSLKGYLTDSAYFGALIGRYGNRIARGQFSLHGTRYTLPLNDGPNALHGGRLGFHKVVWTATHASLTPQGPQLTLTYSSPDGEEGYPGTLKVVAVYTLAHEDALQLDYTASVDRDTVVNLTQHSYYNLRASGDILNSIVQINAQQFTPVDSTLIPTGALRPVAGTPFDFRTPTAIGARIDADDEQLRFGQGYDHNWIIDKPSGALGVMARVLEPRSGRVLEVSSTEPAMQFYSGNSLSSALIGKGGRQCAPRTAFAIEPQHYPDSPNHANFPSTVLKPGQVYSNTIVHRFSTL
jgi:aldose 1-epimerase